MLLEQLPPSPTEISALKTFNLLALGHRGAGKTVFLMGSYASARPTLGLSQAWRLWFDCEEVTAQQYLEGLLHRVANTGSYPPPTAKVTSFLFRLQRRALRGAQTLCQFQWCDVPGEICTLRNPTFQSMVLNSHGGCLFIDAPALAKHGHLYLETQESLLRQIEIISAHVQSRGLRYPLALILTKCDRLPYGPRNADLRRHLMPLLTHLNQAKAHYQTFYSAIPIVEMPEGADLMPTSAVAPFLWLTSELRTLYRTQTPRALATSLQALFRNFDDAQTSVSPTFDPPTSTTNSVRTLVIMCCAALFMGLGLAYLLNQKELQPREQTESAVTEPLLGRPYLLASLVSCSLRLSRAQG